MTTDKKLLTELSEKPVFSLLLQYAIPAIVAMVASSLYNIVDGIFIGQGVGAGAIMGLAITMPIMNLSAAFGAMVGVGGSTLLSVKLGEKDYNFAAKILGNVITLNCIIGIGLGAVMLLFLDPILRFFGASDYTIPYARDFMVIVLIGNVFTHLFLGLNAMLRSSGKPKNGHEGNHHDRDNKHSPRPAVHLRFAPRHTRSRSRHNSFAAHSASMAIQALFQSQRAYPPAARHLSS